MAVVAAPIAAAGVGAVYFVALTKTYSSAANFTAKKAFDVEDAYPWPFWRKWTGDDSRSNSTVGGTAAALGLAALTFGVQRRFLWRHLGNSLRVPVSEQKRKIKNTAQLVKVVGPGVAEVSANMVGTCLIVGAARPFLDGNNVSSHKSTELML